MMSDHERVRDAKERIDQCIANKIQEQVDESAAKKARPAGGSQGRQADRR